MQSEISLVWEHACEIRTHGSVSLGTMRYSVTPHEAVVLQVRSDHQEFHSYTLSSLDLFKAKYIHPDQMEICMNDFEDIILSIKDELYRSLARLHQSSQVFLPCLLHPKQFYSTYEPSIFKIFNTQAQAFEYFDGLHDTNFVKTYTFESSITGKRKFLVAHENTFLYRYIQQAQVNKRHVYEIIRESFPCRLYFDIEFYYEFNQHKNTHILLEKLIYIIAWKIYEFFRVPIDATSFIDLESSTCTKFSHHLSVIITDEKSGDEILFVSNRHVGSFVYQMLQDMIEEGDVQKLDDCKIYSEFDDLFVRNADRKRVSIVDMGVYTRNRAFRIFQSCKFGKKAILKVAMNGVDGVNKLLPLPSLTKRDVLYRQILRMSYIVPYNALKMDTERISEALPHGVLEVGASLYFFCFSRPSLHAHSHCDSRLFPENGIISSRVKESSPFPALDAFILSLVDKGGVQGELRSWSWNRFRLVYQIDKNKWCDNIGRPHKSNGVMMNADLFNGLVYQTCWDPDCRGFRSLPIPIPTESRPPWVEVERIFSSKQERYVVNTPCKS